MAAHDVLLRWALRVSMAFRLRRLRGNPNEDAKGWDGEGKDSIKRVARRVGMPVHGDKNLDAKHQGEEHGQPAGPRHGTIYPTPFFEPGTLHVTTLLSRLKRD